MQPRSYQVEANQSIFGYFLSNTGNPVVAMPTGTGKSVVIGMFCWEVLWQYPGQKIMVLTHVKELIEQNYSKLKALWPNAPAGIFSAGLGRREAYLPITFAGIGSVAKKAHLFGRVDLVLIDECHMVSATDTTMYQKFLAELRQANPNLKVVGFSATPWRLGQGRITDEGGLFTDICFDITGVEAFNRLIAEGYLSPLIPKRTRTMLDTDGVHMRGGEFISSELQAAVDRDEVTQAALAELVEQGTDRKHWLLFSSGIEHAEHIGQMLSLQYGVDNVVIHSKMAGGDAARDEAIRRFKAGEVRCAINNNVLTTGFDFPGIDLIGMLRPTASPVLWVQMLGRGTRPWEGKDNCLVLDFAGNTGRLGPINDPVIPRKAGKGGGEAPVRICDACGTYNHASVKHCICCGAEFHFVTKLKMSAGTADLVAGEMPVVELFKVDHITYTIHTKLGSPPSVRVSYYCGLRSFLEFVCVQHEGWAKRKAREWWALRTSQPMPDTTEEAMQIISTLMPATHLRVWVNKKYPQIMNCCLDGTAFGTQMDDGHQVQVDVGNNASRGASSTAQLEDDDIPF